MEFELVLGFEIHTELKTKTKVFCGCSTAFRRATQHPGVPRLPGSARVDACPQQTRDGPLAPHGDGAPTARSPNSRSSTARTTTTPTCPRIIRSASSMPHWAATAGWISPLKDGTSKHVRINNIHLEEDAGKLLHPDEPGAKYSIVDLNRTGQPLLEIVTEPDMRSMEEATAFMSAMRSLLRYIDISDCKMEEGSLRFEANISGARDGQRRPQPEGRDQKTSTPPKPSSSALSTSLPASAT